MKTTLTRCAVLLLTFLFTLNLFAMDGSGTEGDPYQVKTRADLEQIATWVNAGTNAASYYKQMNNINMLEGANASDSRFTPIGIYAKPFAGHYDGDSKVISNLYINGEYEFAGLFGRIEGATIENLGVENASITSTGDYVYAGGLVGVCSNKELRLFIKNCYVTGNVKAEGESEGCSGGLVGYNLDATMTITDCYATGSVSATATGKYSNAYAGGLVGYSYNSTIENCYAAGLVTATATQNNGSAYAGGLVGRSVECTIENCYATGAVTATGNYACAGGLVGRSVECTIENCYATGSVSATATGVGSYAYAGGLVGDSYNSTIENCYATGAVTATGNYACAGGLVGYNGGTITNCYATGSVTATATGIGFHASAGGLVGNNTGTITNCYATSNVGASANVETYAGGLVGENYGEVTNCYYDTQTTGQSDDTDKGEPKTTAEMKSQDFVNLLNDTLINSDSPFKICADSYPVLYYQKATPIVVEKYLLTVSGGTIKGGSETSGEYAEGDKVTIVAGSAKPGYVFDIWTCFPDDVALPDDHATDTTAQFTMPAHAVSFIAKYKLGTLSGSGTEKDPFEIKTRADLEIFSARVSAGINADSYYKQMYDIDMLEGANTSDSSFTPIGRWGSVFAGHYDGNSKVISNLYVNSDYKRAGLFDRIENATIKNLGLENASITSTDFYTGGLVGYCNSGTIENCYATGSVTGATFTGGLVGYCNSGTIENCYATGNVTATGRFAGGLVGSITSTQSEIKNCYYDKETTGQGGAGIGLSSEQMVDSQGFVNLLNGSDGFSDSPFKISADTYPVLYYQKANENKGKVLYISETGGMETHDGTSPETAYSLNDLRTLLDNHSIPGRDLTFNFTAGTYPDMTFDFDSVDTLRIIAAGALITPKPGMSLISVQSKCNIFLNGLKVSGIQVTGNNPLIVNAPNANLEVKQSEFCNNTFANGSPRLINVKSIHMIKVKTINNK